MRFDELPDTGVHVVYDTGVRVELVDPASASDAGSAVALVDGFTGRQPLAGADGRLPADFAATSPALPTSSDTASTGGRPNGGTTSTRTS